MSFIESLIVAVGLLNWALFNSNNEFASSLVIVVLLNWLVIKERVFIIFEESETKLDKIWVTLFSWMQLLVFVSKI
jgi:hypothetical protein